MEPNKTIDSAAPQKFNKGEKIKEAQIHLRALRSDQEFSLDKKAIMDLAGELQDHSVFSYARRLYQALYKHFPGDEKIVEKLAVCTYKDTDLSSESKFDIAAKLLISHFQDGDTNKITDPNILGILGSIFKKKWKYDNFTGHLYQSMRYYLEGFEQAKKRGGKALTSIGYCGVNLAFVYDLLADLEAYTVRSNEVGATTIFSAKDPLVKLQDNFKKEAENCRKEVIAHYKSYLSIIKSWDTASVERQAFEQYSHYWFFATWAEALLGLGEFEATKNFLEIATNKRFKDYLEDVLETEDMVRDTATWMIDSTRLQCHELSELLYLKNKDQFAQAKYAMMPLLKGEEVVENQNIKLGLALSGGGFRASLFHIGVLAKLAEADLLKRVEVISCVSGGSILGAYYYMKLRELVNERPKDSLTKQDYIELVKRIEEEFLLKINKNIRLRIFGHFLTNLKMAALGKYTRTLKTASLYNRFIYSTKEDKALQMNDLLIKPGGKPFIPNLQNWSMKNKVPILVLNATTLNTGHSWQFTSTYMGESPAFIDSEFDALPNLRRMYYDEAPKAFSQIPLSTAVAASAGVPGLFAPIEFQELFNDINVLLVDGGVHDNQGISTLYEQECNLVIVSDASGQLVEADKPPRNELGVFKRTNDILQERIRYSQFRDLEARKKSGLVRDFILMHLTKGLPSEVVNWKLCDDPYVPPVTKENLKNNAAITTDYQVRIKIQTLLARIRTDLDAFHESEAYALMYSGYKMTEHEIKMASNPVFTNSQSEAEIDAPSATWKFFDIHKVMEDKEASHELERKLKPSSELIGKVFGFSKKVRYTVYSILGALLGLVLFVLSKLSLDYFFWSVVGISILVIVVWLAQFYKVRNAILVPFLVLLSPFVWAVFLLSLALTNKFYLKQGKLPKVEGKD